MPDPQAVPDAVLTRTRAVDPVRLLESPGWDRLADLRAVARTGDATPVRDAFADLVRLGAELVG